MITKKLAVLFGLLLTLPAFSQQMPPLPAELSSLDYLIGHWEGDLTMATAPGQNAKMKSTMVCDKILGDRYVRGMVSFSGDGTPEMTGMTLFTYDGEEKNWIGWWYDSTAPGVTEMTGPLVDGSMILTSKPTKMAAGEIVMRSTWTKVSDKDMKMKVEMQQGTDWVVFVSGEFKKK